MKIRIAKAFTNPVITDRDTNFIKAPSLNNPNNTCKIPTNTVAASKYWSPCSLTNKTIKTAVAAVAAEIIPGRPPKIAVNIEMENEA